MVATINKTSSVYKYKHQFEPSLYPYLDCELLFKIASKAKKENKLNSWR